MIQLSKKMLIFAISSMMDDDIEESYFALTRLRIWKILCMRARSVKAGASRKQNGVYSNYAEAKPCFSEVVPPAVAYIQPAPFWSQLTYIPAGVS